MTTKINDRLVLSGGLEIQPSNQPNTAQTNSGVSLYIDNGVLKMSSNIFGNLEIVTQATTPPEEPPEPTASTIYSLCSLLRPLGNFSGQNYDSTGWDVITSNGVIGEWYKLTFDMCQSNGVSPNHLTGITTIDYTGYYEITINFGGNALSNKLTVLEVGLSFDSNPPPLVSNFVTAAVSEQTTLDVPINVSGTFIQPLNQGDTVTGYIRCVAGTSGFELKMYKTSIQIKKI